MPCTSRAARHPACCLAGGRAAFIDLVELPCWPVRVIFLLNAVNFPGSCCIYLSRVCVRQQERLALCNVLWRNRQTRETNLASSNNTSLASILCQRLYDLILYLLSSLGRGTMYKKITWNLVFSWWEMKAMLSIFLCIFWVFITFSYEQGIICITKWPLVF